MQGKTNRRNVTIAMMVATFLAAIEVTIVSTAMPRIVSDLGGIKLISWVFAVYLLTTSVTTPIYGKLSDLFGRKIIFAIGTILFLVGSMLCGLSQSMQQLIWFRAIQGIGAGAVLPATFTIIGDIYSFEERAKIQGFFSSIWGIAGIVGPLVGGFFVDQISWHWIFYINVPFGVIALIMVWINLDEKFEKKKNHIDYAGAAAFTIATTSLLYALLTGGQQFAWSSSFILGLFALVVIFGALFVWIEAKSPEPMLPLSLFKIRIISISNIASFLVSALLIAINAYIPMWVQGVYGEGATNSGLIMAPMSIGWPLGAVLSGRLLLRLGARTTSLLGTIILLLSSVWLAFISPSMPHVMIVIIMFVSGLGFGLATTVFTVVVQSAVDWNLRGAATASNSFVRTLGQTFGIAVFGTIFNSSMAKFMSAHIHGNAGSQSQDMNQLLNPENVQHMPKALLELMRTGLASSLQTIFYGLIFIAIAALLVVLFLARQGKQEETAHAK
ncbi:MDR family MFS transporter [Aneurinibacillus sp. Ricciae_BoGa-3]|uniref:MDR family MFS transporter n=1 Tax=Aneurinibacillus sp. Ricciae_BoGa-3 TaxID=3022697 RepID=UPI002341F69D|nr:MDR family MFS transporter [Aneurinibacillus sp. Ricciae_BoGa-3]WCK55662.1 MDR family MFS transporter [Aneurinibacillus sp. Ricciae_BoGa-3]